MQKIFQNLKTKYLYEFSFINTFHLFLYIIVQSMLPHCGWIINKLPYPRDSMSYCRHSLLHQLPISITFTFHIFKESSLAPSQGALIIQGRWVAFWPLSWKESYHELQAQKVKHIEFFHRAIVQMILMCTQCKIQ